jgi:hypothetical protein
MEHQQPERARPLLPYLDSLNMKIPELYDASLGQLVTNDDWLIFEKRLEEVTG